MNGMIQLAYFSSTSSAWSPRDTNIILQISRKKNALREITGLLLYDKGHYLQVIEGATTTIIELYDVISRDPRHTGVTQVFRRPIYHREFTGWSMAYQEVTLIEPDLDGYAGFLKENFDIGSLDVTATKSFFRLFKLGNTPLMLATSDTRHGL